LRVRDVRIGVEGESMVMEEMTVSKTSFETSRKPDHPVVLSP